MKYITTFNAVFFALIALQLISLVLNKYVVAAYKKLVMDASGQVRSNKRLLVRTVLFNLFWVGVIGFASWISWPAVTTFFAVVIVATIPYGVYKYRKERKVCDNLLADFQMNDVTNLMH